MLDLIYSPKTISIYIHWPYCLSKCPYCDFNSYISNNVIHDDWEQAYINEIHKFLPFFYGKNIKTLFFGGGTPSLMSPKTVERIINTFYKINSYVPLIEITLECNPSTVEISKLNDFKKAGVNRISLGVQSFSEKNLRFLKRTHNLKEAISALNIANNTFGRVSFDLINGLPNQTLNDWKQELKFASEFITSHISIYELTIEPGTKFFKDKVQSPKDELAIEMFNYNREFLSGYNIFPYEISNYAKLGFESLHNLQYWQGGLYLGIGPGAHSRVVKNKDIYAITAYKNPQKWLKMALSNQPTFEDYELLTKEQRILELFLMHLRLYKNIPNMLIDFIDKKAISFLISHNLLNKVKEKYELTHKGRLQLNYVLEYISKNLIEQL